jgi:hypothetical protein
LVVVFSCIGMNSSTVPVKMYVNQYTLFTEMGQALRQVVNSEQGRRVTR